MDGALRQAVRLMLVTDDALLAGRDVMDLCRSAERGGVTAVELRLKRVSPRQLMTLAVELLAAVGIPVLVNDRLDVALAAGARGVHLGPEDLPVALARRITPSGFWIGASVGTDVEVAGGAGASYWGIGPFRATTTKGDAGPALGPAGFHRLVEQAPTEIPCVAIGGIEPDDVGAVFEAGGLGVAVGSGILRHPDVEAAARRYRQALGE